MSGSEKRQRTALVVSRVTLEEMAQIRAAATARNLSVGEMIRQALRKTGAMR